MSSHEVEAHFDEIAGGYDRWKQRANYYYEYQKKAVYDVVPTGASVCEVGCGTGDILEWLKPRDGLGLDISPAMVELAREKHPGLRFDVLDITAAAWPETFPYLVAVDVAEHVGDLDASMQNMAQMLAPAGRLVITTANPRWAPILHTAERLKLKMPEGEHEWRSRDDLVTSAEGAGLSLVSFDRSFLVPKRIPGFRRLNSSRQGRWLRARFGLIQRIVLERPAP